MAEAGDTAHSTPCPAGAKNGDSRPYRSILCVWVVCVVCVCGVQTSGQDSGAQTGTPRHTLQVRSNTDDARSQTAHRQIGPVATTINFRRVVMRLVSAEECVNFHCVSKIVRGNTSP